MPWWMIVVAFAGGALFGILLLAVLVGSKRYK